MLYFSSKIGAKLHFNWFLFILIASFRFCNKTENLQFGDNIENRQDFEKLKKLANIGFSRLQ